MKTVLISALSTLVAAQRAAPYPPQGPWGAYPAGWVDFNGGDTAAAGEGMKKMMGNLKPPSEINRSGGSGQYKAKVLEDPSLKGHTIYVPKALPEGKKLPLLLWGNGGCLALGQVHGNVLTDIASHGYVVIANGPADSREVNFSKNTDMFDAALWAAKNGAKYNIDVTSVASAGQSCGGMQAYTGNQVPGIKTTIIFNSGLLTQPQLLRPKLGKTLKGTILYMEGGSIDVGYANVSRHAPFDLDLLTNNQGKADFNSITQVPAVFLSQSTGHAVNRGWHPLIIEWLDWQLKGVNAERAKAKFTAPGALPPFTEHMSKNWK
jgi:hypothetical protein